LIFLPNHNFICYKNSRHLEEYAGNTKYGIPNIKIIVNIRIYTLSDKIDYIIILNFPIKYLDQNTQNLVAIFKDARIKFEWYDLNY
jgi:hypothetical protein